MTHPEPEAPAAPPPLTSERLHLAPGVPVREALARAMHAILRHALDAAAHVDVDGETAVHAWRKAIRRAQALVELAAYAMPDGARRRLRAALRAAFQDTGHLRDAAVLGAALSDVGLEGEAATFGDLLGRAFAAHRERVAASDDLGRVLSRQAAELDGLVHDFEAALAPDVGARALRRGVRRSYRKARRAWRRARRTGDRHDVHAWRKRMKTLRYHLEALEARGGVPVAAALAASEELTAALGLFADLIALAERVETNHAGLGDRAVADILAAIEERMADHARVALELADPMLGPRPKRFAAALGDLDGA